MRHLRSVPLASVGACDASRDAPSVASEGVNSVQVKSTANPPTLLAFAGNFSSGDVPGFRHVYTKTKFPLGAPLVSVGPIGQSTRYIGAQGVFVEWQNGFSVAFANAVAPVNVAEPLTVHSEQHTARVVDYFRVSGLPQDQLGPPALSTTILQTGTTAGQELSRKFVGFTSILSRVFDGVAVVDSYAWAQFNINDDVVREQVWWPALPAPVRDEIAAFRAMLADSVAAAAFRARLPPGVAGLEGRLAIHHSVPIGVPWYVAVTMDFSPRGPAGVVSIDRGGAQRSFGVPAGPANGVPVESTARPGGGGGTRSGPGNGMGRSHPE